MNEPTPSPAPPLTNEGSKAPAPPSLTGKGTGGLGFHLLTFLLFLSLWTWKLLEPTPVPEAVTAGWSLEFKLVAAKSLHVAGYAFLTVLAATLPAPRRWRVSLVGFLVLHGVGTEIAQYVMDVGRHGCVEDVLIDWVGIALGMLLVRWSNRRRRGASEF